MTQMSMNSKWIKKKVYTTTKYQDTGEEKPNYYYTQQHG